MKNKNLLVLAVVGALLFGVTSATSSYIHEQNGTISICDPDSNGTKCITMQDKNLGASEAGVGCINYARYCYDGAVQEFDSMEECLDNRSYGNCMGWRLFGDLFENEEDCNSRGESLYQTCMTENGTGVYGYHFQRGNKHRFAPNFSGDASFPGGESTGATQEPNCANYGPLNLGYSSGRYDSRTFIRRKSDWCNPRNDNLRGGANDSQENNRGFDETGNVAINATGRQGPCDPGYHVPSIGEWNKVLEYWSQENEIEFEEGDGGLKYNDTTWDGIQFQEDFKIPFAGDRYHIDARVYHVGSTSRLWSSSPYVGGAGVRDFHLTLNEAYADGDDSHANANSVRCFKNSYLSFPTNESGDGGSGSASTHVTLTLTAGSNTCTLNDYNLGTHDASADEQYVESSGQEILCEFLQNTGVRVLLSMGDLSDGSKLIGAENFTGVVTAIGNSLGSISNLTGGNYNLSGSQEIYRKAVNTLGKWTGDLQIIGTIPAGTPSGTYTGSLEIVIQEG